MSINFPPVPSLIANLDQITQNVNFYSDFENLKIPCFILVLYDFSLTSIWSPPIPSLIHANLSRAFFHSTNS